MVVRRVATTCGDKDTIEGEAWVKRMVKPKIAIV